MTPFSLRHLGSAPAAASEIAKSIGFASVDDLIDAVIPQDIRLLAELQLPLKLTEAEALGALRAMLSENREARSLIGQGYHDCLTPPVIQRNVLENPGWYTAYTPYQPEISQGRLEALLLWQTMIRDLSGLDIANASLLDEGSAAAEAVALALGGGTGKKVIFVDEHVLPQTIDVIRTRAKPIGGQVVTGSWQKIEPSSMEGLAAVVVAYPAGDGLVHDYSAYTAEAKAVGALVIVVSDPLALCLLQPPGSWGADICVGSGQRFGVPMGFGGPHAGFMAVKDALKRRMPGRLIGVSVDAHGAPASRLALQTREQHIRRDKATSNICTAQVLLAVMAAMYAVWHGPEGLRGIASYIRRLTAKTAEKLRGAGFFVPEGDRFDTVLIRTELAEELMKKAESAGFLLRHGENAVSFSLDECSNPEETARLLTALGVRSTAAEFAECEEVVTGLDRTVPFLTHPEFHNHRTETQMMRYLRHLEHRDIALNRSMIALGSCTMKLNAAAEMMPLSWSEISRVHPFAPDSHTVGYRKMLTQLEEWLAEITGFAGVSLQPNSGAQGEFAGLLAIAGYHASRGDHGRNVCLLPVSAHGTNPASAVLAGMRVVPVKCDDEGNIDAADFTIKLEEHRDNLGALMMTYPSTHGVYEEGAKKICQLVHDFGGQVYMDGANMNAQVGYTSPGLIGADVCHLNLHKTFCIPHGGGGPGVGPIGVAAHLLPWLPGHARLPRREGAVAAAPYGSASITSISWMYIAMMGAPGLRDASALAILNANYMAKRLAPCFPILYTGKNGLVAHECILDLRGFHKVTVEDVAKRLIDFGFHSPTMSWPVAGTLMVEPTESESRDEMDRFCEAMITIHAEIQEVESGAVDAKDNLLKNAPHTAAAVLTDEWTHPYSRERAAFPLAWVREDKYWPPVGRVDNVYGDRNLVCDCGPVEDYVD